MFRGIIVFAWLMHYFLRSRWKMMCSHILLDGQSLIFSKMDWVWWIPPAHLMLFTEHAYYAPERHLLFCNANIIYEKLPKKGWFDVIHASTVKNQNIYRNFSLREIAWKWFDLKSRVIWGRLSGTMAISLLFAPLDPAPPSYNSRYLPSKKPSYQAI